MVSYPFVPPTTTAREPIELLPLEPGDHLDQPTFHARYEAMPEDFRAQLIEGVVYVMASPVGRRHGKHQALIIHWLQTYDNETPGVEAYDNSTNILGPESEPEPDGCLVILPEALGQTRDIDGYIVGAPELAAEVATSTDAIDLHAKKRDFERAGVKEYIVVVPRKQRVFWFILRNGRFEDLQPGADGILRSEVFPGLWLDPAALLNKDGKRVQEVLRQGLASPEHAALVAKLASL